jgi:hypothetical protein
VYDRTQAPAGPRKGVHTRGGRPAAAPAPALTPRGLSPAGALALQRLAGNRATTKQLQRMILAIDGPNDKQPSKNATVACLWNLTHRKRSQDYGLGDARGRVEGPQLASQFPAHMRPLLGSSTESIYVLAHGSRWSHSIGDMSPAQMAGWLRAHFSSRVLGGPLGWFGVTGDAATFTGKIKLVSCHSGADRSHQTTNEGTSSTGAHPYEFDRSYAEALAVALKPKSKSDPFRPSSVQGVVGIGWVDEETGKITGLDKEKYDTASGTWSSNSDVGSGTGSGKSPNPFTDMTDPTARGRAIRAVFGDPVDVSVTAQDPDKLDTMRSGKGHWGKRTFAVGTGAEL